MAKNPRTGSSFDDFLKEEGIYEECTATALKNILARQLAAEMKKKGLTKTVMATRMKTSRSQLDRLLDPHKNRGVAGNYATSGAGGGPGIAR